MNGKAQELLSRLESQLVELWGDEYDAPEGWENYPLSGLCYGERDGCVNEQSPMWNDESLEISIVNLFYQFFKAVRDTVEDEQGLGAVTKDWIKIVVEPSYEDTSFIVIFLVNARRIVYNNDIKAWHHEFQTPEDLAEELKDVYETMTSQVTK